MTNFSATIKEILWDHHLDCASTIISVITRNFGVILIALISITLIKCLKCNLLTKKTFSQKDRTNDVFNQLQLSKVIPDVI